MVKATEVQRCTILRRTVIKQSTVPAIKLSNDHKTMIDAGAYLIRSWSYRPGNHLCLNFSTPIKNRHAWIIYRDDVTLADDNKTDLKPIRLNVPYYSQRDNQHSEWWRQCNSSSHAMLLNFLKPGSIAGDDDYIDRFVIGIGDTTHWAVHTRALKQFGIESQFRQNLDYDDLQKSLTAGYPIPIGVLHKGSVYAPSGEHIVLVVGHNKVNDSFICHDPWGHGFTYEDHQGKFVEYPVEPSLDRRWLCDGDNSGWGRIITAVDGKSTGLR